MLQSDVTAEKWDGGVQEDPNASKTGESLLEECGYHGRGQMYVLGQLCLVPWADTYLCTGKIQIS